ncbi:hypothetical protein [Hansschlegelia sp.]|uniref:hypothetical protein n=1 Tax=Hansschlegelia sp. TaxID=2041892 RepID=UPI002C9B1A1C|nr:hypothetical protein [Hansschlegelia sp.]HVI28853.1 hypothetical protein [Hansschlegelia sp.]
MARVAVIEAVEAKLADAFPNDTIVGVLNGGARPAGNAGFLLVQYPVVNSEQASVGDPGNNVFRDEGVFSVLVHQPKAAKRAAVEKADAVADLFRGQEFAGVTCFAPQSARFDDDNDRGLYIVASVAVPYHFDYLG